jgi:hypothetical protein
LLGLKISANSEVSTVPKANGPLKRKSLHLFIELAGDRNAVPTPRFALVPVGTKVVPADVNPWLVRDVVLILPLTDNTKSEPDSSSVNNNAIYFFLINIHLGQIIF